MRLTVLGTGTIAFSATRSCASYYVEAGNARMLIDCGSGTTRRLAELSIPWQQLTHIALTHFHIDHHQDLPTILFAGKYGMLPPRAAPLDIVGPRGTRDLLNRLAAAYGEWVLDPGYELRITELDSGGAMDVGGASFGCMKVPHTAESIAYSVVEGDRRLVYSGDTGFDPAFASWAHGCDTMVLECSLPAPMAIVEHLTPEQCGEMARLAEPKRLVLTHLYPPVESVDISALVRANYGGPLVIAHDGWQTDFQE
ncbi:MAG TPA: MBL fold metallo-hydrolase [Gemmatimonadaceae bacterium]|nr:MBL fold metallo-hydrolase [Gemmatimonadaceae bacterium]